MPLTKRQRQIILMSLTFFHTYGPRFVSLIKERYPGHKEDNLKAWDELKEQIAELRTELTIKFHASPPSSSKVSEPTQDRP
jgi:hypothetical protein